MWFNKRVKIVNTASTSPSSLPFVKKRWKDELFFCSKRTYQVGKSPLRTTYAGRFVWGRTKCACGQECLSRGKGRQECLSKSGRQECLPVTHVFFWVLQLLIYWKSIDWVIDYPVVGKCYLYWLIENRLIHFSIFVCYYYWLIENRFIDWLIDWWHFLCVTITNLSKIDWLIDYTVFGCYYNSFIENRLIDWLHGFWMLLLLIYRKSIDWLSDWLHDFWLLLQLIYRKSVDWLIAWLITRLLGVTDLSKINWLIDYTVFGWYYKQIHNGPLHVVCNVRGP